MDASPTRLPRRVLHINSGNLFGGVEILLLTLASQRHLCSTMEPEFALAFDGPVARQLADTGVKVHLLGPARARNPLSILRARRRLSEVLALNHYDAAICHMPWTQAVFGPPIRSSGLPMVCWLHSPVSRRHWIERWAALSRPHLVLCNSEFTAQSAGALYPIVPVVVVLCPVALGGLRLTTDERRAVRAELGTAADDVVIVQASRMEPWKGHRLLIEGLALMRDLPGWSCWIAGGARRPHEIRYVEELRRLLSHHSLTDRVRLLGHRNDVRSLLAAADIYCQPNVGPEPFGLAFVEALDAGLPVVSTAIGGVREIVNGSCGLLVGPENSGELAGALRMLMQEPERRQAMAKAGPARARVLCDPATRLAELAAAIGTIVEATPSPLSKGAG